MLQQQETLVEVWPISHYYTVMSLHLCKSILQKNFGLHIPTLATGGSAIITSTPNSDEDTFAVIWKERTNKYDANGNEQEVGINGFHGFTAKWDEHPDRDEEWKEEEIGRIGEERFRREYGCEFLVYDETLNKV